MVIPRYNFQIPKEHARFAKAVGELFGKIKSARETHDLNLSRAQRLEVLQKVMSATRTKVFSSVEDYMIKRDEVYDAAMEGGLGMKVDADQLNAID